jgi:acyl-coenzyme A synthetase/AMP-(fatty) acid ligase
VSGAPIPLIGRAADDILFRLPGGGVRADAFAEAAARLAMALPDAAEVLNLCRDRLAFALGVAATVLRGQVALLSSDRSVDARRLDAGVLSDEDVAPFRPLASRVRDEGRGLVPIPPDRPAALVFTSGSTGEPMAHRKLFGALAARSEDAGAAFGFERDRPTSIVAMAPPQHMYGFETSVLLPLHAACSVWCGPCFYPADVQAALEAVPAPRLLVTTPFQLRALLASDVTLPPLAAIVSATAPMPDTMAAAAEARFGCKVREIFGATEVGSIAHRRTLDGPDWTLYPRVRLEAEGDTVAASGPFAPAFPLSDLVALHAPGRFRLLGRRTDVVKLGGRRASLAGLSSILTGIEGVVDGAFVAPDDLDRRPTARLPAFVVAPRLEREALLAALRQRIDPVFLPRRVIRVEALPRNALGKLPDQAVARLIAEAGGA